MLDLEVWEQAYGDSALSMSVTVDKREIKVADVVLNRARLRIVSPRWVIFTMAARGC